MNINKISRYRSAIMGFSIFWIMAYHSGVSCSSVPIVGTLLNNFRSNGFGGVDIFLFVSGFGLYRSLSCNPEQLAFYKRRFLRVLPAYMPVLVLWLFLNRSNVSAASWFQVLLSNLTGTSFWIGPGPSFNWYMPALFSFYFIAPFFFQVMKKCGVAWIIAATLILDACFYGQYVMIAVTRFTVFSLGMALGRWEEKRTQAGESRRIDFLLELVCYVLGLFSYWLLVIFRASLSDILLWNGGFYWYPFIFSAPALVFLLCRLFSLLEARFPLLLRPFEIAGDCSLEIYLIHIVLFQYLSISSSLVWLFVFAAMILCGYIYHVVLSKFVARLSKVC